MKTRVWTISEWWIWVQGQQHTTWVILNDQGNECAHLATLPEALNVLRTHLILHPKEASQR